MVSVVLTNRINNSTLLKLLVPVLLCPFAAVCQSPPPRRQRFSIRPACQNPPCLNRRSY